MTPSVLFSNLDFTTIANNPDFKEDSVREEIILPILKKLGYAPENIVRSKTLHHPFLKIGSRKRKINLIPDYLLKIGNNYAWVLDAKAPNQQIDCGGNVEQVYSYAVHPEIRCNYFALCNGLEFAVFRTNDNDTPILFFRMEEFEQYWQKLVQYLSPSSFQSGQIIRYEIPHFISVEPFDYGNRPLLGEISVKKQKAKRHFGVHGYFTKQTWNVVEAYIKNFSKPGDVVLDPFGGSGVTIIEALMNGRKGINVDINPLAVFIVQSLLVPINQAELRETFEKVKKEYLLYEPKTKKEIKETLERFKGPRILALPKGSDVKTVDKLFSDKQIAQLALLKSIIKKRSKGNIQDTLMLMFSGLLTKANLTYHNNPNRPTAGGGNASVFAYYRYRIAPDPVEIDIIKYFELRYQKVAQAKKEMEYYITEQVASNAQIIKGSATNLSFLPNESVDYIYTDPPYGKKIPYLDLSAMWLAWLDLKVKDEDYELEAIEGGKLEKSKKEYNHLIEQSIREIYRVLKFDRWLSFVFAHKDPEFWHLIINTAESCGFEYVGAVPQKNGQTSFKKRQHPFTVLSGQLIINFRKVRSPRAIMRANLGMDISEIVIQTIEGIIAKQNGATLEQINDELIIKGLELGFLDLLKREYSDLTSILMDRFHYDENTEIFSIPKGKKFQTQIDVDLRIKYYLISYLRRMDRENKPAPFDEIVQSILPLLKNGVTPERQTILSVLEDIAEHIGGDCWKLKQTGQKEFLWDNQKN
ncbi:MAG: type I restriction enzyme HsdR N-terminal domain-containing protein [Planctomycetaceae bacterium]|jgi:DNA modification methylase|nr:type I restriction enzyme HsdR N-terminal domain-containing protein [Planctomycetaceae bacterium]